MKIFLIVIIIIPLLSFPQKQANIWYFAEYSGLDFTKDPPVPITNGQIHSTSSGSEGCSSISDSSGKLLFYASPTSIWNRNHKLMPNGTNLLGGESSSQGVLIIPKPGSSELFYLFTLDEFQHNLVNGLRYSVVNMCLDNGMGDVIASSKNILLLDGTGEKMTAAYHRNGTDIWLVTRKHFTNEFYSFLITSSGISAPIITGIGWSNPQQEIPNAIGQMKISPDGSKLAFAVGNNNPFIVQLFDFNNSTGVISNPIDLPTSVNTGNPYGVAFSPDNSKLYIEGPAPTGINQFDLSSGIADKIKNSLFHVPWAESFGGLGLQLASNGKIYVTQFQHIGVINSPNLAGSACDFTGNFIPSNPNYTLPGFIDNFKYKNGIPNCNPGINQSEEPISFYPNIVSSEATLKIKKSLSNATLIIYNAIGQKIKEIKNLSGNNITLQCNNLPSGVYFTRLFQDNKAVATNKFIIEN